MLAQTSLEAFKSIQDKLTERQSDVLEAIEEIAPATNNMIAEHLGWTINRITPRVKELRMKNKVELSHRGKDITGNNANYWQPVGMEQQNGECN